MSPEQREAAQNLSNALAGFYGSDQSFFNAMNRKVSYSEGFREFTLRAGNGAGWLLGILITEPAILKEAKEFASITLTVTEDNKAVLMVTDGGKGAPEITVYRREIEFTDCPVGVWNFYFENMMIMLPRER